MKFLTKVSKKSSSPVFTLSDIDRMKNYQCELINTMIYLPKKSQGGAYSYNLTNMLTFEIKEVEKWLKTATQEIINNNSRKYL